MIPTAQVRVKCSRRWKELARRPTVHSKRSVNALTLLFPQPPRMAAGSLHHLGRGCGDRKDAAQRKTGGHPFRLGFVASSEKRVAHPLLGRRDWGFALLQPSKSVTSTMSLGVESQDRGITSRRPAPRAWLKSVGPLHTHTHRDPKARAPTFCPSEQPTEPHSPPLSLLWPFIPLVWPVVFSSRGET